MSFDGVASALFAGRLESIVRAMTNTLFRTGRSGVLNTGRDFSCCLVTPDHQLLAAADSLPIHVMVGPDLMSRELLARAPKPQAGDAFLHNSPYHGNSHAADHCLLVPVVDRHGIHRMTVIAKAHQADCGNGVPTTYAESARDVYEEGALIFRCTRVQSAYRDHEDVLDLCRLRIRVPEQWWGDYLALLGAARVGERLVLALGEDLGWGTLERRAGEWLDYSERMMAQALAQLPSGRAEGTSIHDPAPGAPEGVRVRARVRVDAAARRAVIDLRANDDCLPCGLNLSEATATTAALLGLVNSIGMVLPMNSGAFRRVAVLLRENCCVGVPRHPASCSLATTNLADRVVNAVQTAVAQLGEGVGMAEAGAIIPPSQAVVSGRDARGRAFINEVILGLSGGPASAHADGWLTLAGAGSAGMLYQDSVEMDEELHPILIVEQRILADTEGAGRTCGAPSVRVEFGPTEGPLEVVYASDGTVHAAQGVRGGSAGHSAAQRIRSADGRLRDAPPHGSVTLDVGERIVAVAAAGGGYGDPRLREPEVVARDVAEGWITRARARDVYGCGAFDGAAGARPREEEE